MLLMWYIYISNLHSNINKLNYAGKGRRAGENPAAYAISPMCGI